MNKNLERIKVLAFDPKGSVEWWSQADKPFLFVAACIELARSVSASSPGSVLTRMPVLNAALSPPHTLCDSTGD